MSDNPIEWTQEKIGELTYQAESTEFNEPGGMMDQYTTAMGHIIHLESEPNISPEKVVPKTSAIQPVAFFMPEKMNLEGQAVQSIEFKIQNYVSEQDSKVILYCGSGGRSAFAAQRLQQLGFTDVYSMQGGIKGWAQAGFDVV